ncbi:hypothetical protein, partial [Pseudoalteromonas sp.]|uniref:hypothetical protein n=1 Tax=Pseudoalteromonas sp. TaxID=53249 RepID=UPI00356B4628
LSCIGGLAFTALYLAALGIEWQMSISIPAMIMFVFICSQYGFANLTSLSLHGEEATVAKLNLFVLAISVAVLSMLSLNYINSSNLYWVLPVICGGFILRNFRAKMVAQSKFVKQF